MISSQRPWPLDNEVGHTVEFSFLYFLLFVFHVKCRNKNVPRNQFATQFFVNGTVCPCCSEIFEICCISEYFITSFDATYFCTLDRMQDCTLLLFCLPLKTDLLKQPLSEVEHCRTRDVTCQNTAPTSQVRRFAAL